MSEKALPKLERTKEASMTKFIPLFSGSTGNCLFLGSAVGGILIDAGVSAKRIAGALEFHGLAPAKIAAVFVTHEHGDHVAGLRVFCGRHHVPVFATAGTLRALEQKNLTEKLSAQSMPTGGVEVNDLLVLPFQTSHDACEPCGYRVEDAAGATFAIATDTGYITDETRSALAGCDTVMLESNHEVNMLLNGPYDYWLKRRVLSDQGHLSNAACAEFLPELLHRGTARFFLAHLSQENNTPELAYTCAESTFQTIGARNGIDYELTVCSP
jgi:phosphoribosyl 1,2-cyclic phosphodiesterase